MSEGKNGNRAPEAPEDALEGFVAERFEDPAPAPKFGFFPSILSILSLVVMTGISVYMANQVSHPPLRISSAQGGEGPARLRQFSASSSSHHVRETLR